MEIMLSTSWQYQRYPHSLGNGRKSFECGHPISTSDGIIDYTYTYDTNTRTIQIHKRRQIQLSERRMKTVVLDDVGRSVERERDSIGEGQLIY